METAHGRRRVCRLCLKAKRLNTNKCEDIRSLTMQSFRFACARRRIEKTGKRASVVAVISPARLGTLNDSDHSPIVLHHQLAVVDAADASNFLALHSSRACRMATFWCVAFHLPLAVRLKVDLALGKVIGSLAKRLPVLRARLHRCGCAC
jgi:hypothetical protein